MAVKAKELREKRAKLIADARKINDEHGDEIGALPADKQAQFDKMLDEASELEANAKRQERLEHAEGAMSAVVGDPLPKQHPLEPGAKGDGAYVLIRGYGQTKEGMPLYHKSDLGKRGSASYHDAFTHALRYGQQGLAVEQYAALQSDNAEQAGYLVASEQFASELLKEVDDLLFIRQYARIHTVREASSLGIRKRTARMNTFAWSAELQVSAEDTALKYGKKVLTPHHCTGLAKVSRDLLRRAIMSPEMIVREEMARDAGEVMEDAYLTGDGNEKPLGAFVASSDGISTSRDVDTGSGTSITADGLINAKYALKGQYRRGGRGPVRWLFHRDAIKIIAKLKDGEGQYLFRPGMGIRGDDPVDDLLGFPIDESERAPNTFTSGNYVGLLANWRYYEIADALDMEVQVLLEKYADTNQVGYIGRLKTDGMPTLEEAFVRLKCD